MLYDDYEIYKGRDVISCGHNEMTSILELPVSHFGFYIESFPPNGPDSSFESFNSGYGSFSLTDFPNSFESDSSLLMKETDLDKTDLIGLTHVESSQINLFWERYNQYPQYLKKIKKRNRQKAKKSGKST